MHGSWLRPIGLAGLAVFALTDVAFRFSFTIGLLLIYAGRVPRVCS